MDKTLKIIGIVYSVLSLIALPGLLLVQFFSIFLFDNPSSTLLPLLIAFGIFLIPVVLVISNILMWKSIGKSNVKVTVTYILLPILYTVLFFGIWFLAGSEFLSLALGEILISTLLPALYLALFFGIWYFYRKI